MDRAAQLMQGQMQALRVPSPPTRKLKPAVEELAHAPMQKAVAAANALGGLAMSKHAAKPDMSNQRMGLAGAAGALNGPARAVGNAGAKAKIGPVNFGRQRRPVSTLQPQVAMTPGKMEPIVVPAGGVGAKGGK